MGLYIRLAWRNLFRNKRRTIIAGTAIGIGLAALIYTDALMLGMKQHMIDSATGSFLGDGQILRRGFRDNLEVEKTIVDLDRIEDRLRQESIVTYFTLRTVSFAMISSPANMASITMVGIQPESEVHLSHMDDALAEGEYIREEGDRDVIVGSGLAELLEVQLGDRVVITVAEAHTGDLSQEMFRISGIYRTGAEEMDKGMALVSLEKAQQMLNLEGQAHQIAIKFTETDFGADKNLPFWKSYSNDENEAVGWTVLLPQMEAVLEMSQFATLMVGVILFAVVTLGIINTLFMSLYERMFEFGVMRAVGTRPFAMGRLVVLEAGALAVFSIGLGLLIGFAATYITLRTGIDYSGIEFAGVTFNELLYPQMELYQFTILPLFVFLFTVAVGVYPATYAARMNPAEAMRRSL